MKTAVQEVFSDLEKLHPQLFNVYTTEGKEFVNYFHKYLEMEKEQLFLASNTSAKEAYKAGQKTMNCGCYEISDATTYEEWLYEQFKSE